MLPEALKHIFPADLEYRVAPEPDFKSGNLAIRPSLGETGYPAGFV